MPVTTQAPTMRNPASITTLEEARAELRYLNDRAFALAQQLHEMTVIAHRQTELINHLVDLHVSGRQEALQDKLDQLHAYRTHHAKRPAAH